MSPRPSLAWLLGAAVGFSGCVTLDVRPKVEAASPRAPAEIQRSVEIVVPGDAPVYPEGPSFGQEWVRTVEKSRLFSHVYSREKPTPAQGADLRLTAEFSSRLDRGRFWLLKSVLTGALLFLPAPWVPYHLTVEAQGRVEVQSRDGRKLKSYEARSRAEARTTVFTEGAGVFGASAAAQRLLTAELAARLIEDADALLRGAAAGGAPGTLASVPHLPPPTPPSYRLPERPQDFAVVVGVERYRGVVPAEFAERDADAVAGHLRALGVPARNLVRLEGTEAGFSALKKYVEAWLPRNAAPEGRVYFYFSGHGATRVENGETYLLPWDGDPSYLRDTAYPLKRLYAQLGALPAKEVVVALDACFSGAGGRSVLPAGARPLVTRIEEPTPVEGKVTLFTAASGAQITATLPERGHGTFTYYFLKGLDGAAAGADGRVSARGLYRYLKPLVEDEARRQNRDQAPGFFADGDLVLR